MPPITVTYNGQTKTLHAWAMATGIPYSTLRSRLGRLGMTVEQAFTQTVDGRFRPVRREERSAPKPVPRYQEDDRGKAFSRWVDPVTHERVRKVWGVFGDKDAERAYRRWAAEWIASGGEPTADNVSVARLVLRYVEFAEQTYRKHDKITSEFHGVRAALRLVNDLYGDTAAAEFTTVKLMAVQRQWATKPLAVKTCNDYLHRVVRCWSWGVSRGMVPAAVADALAHVPTLKRGRSEAKPSVKRKPANDADLEAALAMLATDSQRKAAITAVLRIQRLTGLRPNEVLEMKPQDIDRSATPWLYVPGSGGKTLHMGKAKRAYIGPQARELLAPWLLDCPADRRVWMVDGRLGGLVPLTLKFVRYKLVEACGIARVPAITPHQIRHTYATSVQRKYEDDAIVAAAIGDTREVARQVYSDDPEAPVAKRVAEALG